VQSVMMSQICSQDVPSMFDFRDSFDTVSTPFRHRFDTVSTPFRHRFDTVSTPFRHRFDTVSTRYISCSKGYISCSLFLCHTICGNATRFVTIEFFPFSLVIFDLNRVLVLIEVQS